MKIFIKLILILLCLIAVAIIGGRLAVMTSENHADILSAVYGFLLSPLWIISIIFICRMRLNFNFSWNIYKAPNDEFLKEDGALIMERLNKDGSLIKNPFKD